MTGITNKLSGRSAVVSTLVLAVCVLSNQAVEPIKANAQMNTAPGAEVSKQKESIMESQRIYEQWHEAVVHRDLDKIMSLYDDNASLESPLVWTVLKENNSGVLRGKTAICDFFAMGFRSPENGLGRWYRTGLFFSNGHQLTWEYPRETPDGDQIDLVEVMDISNGRIVHHRVYWGWVGFKTLSAIPVHKPVTSGKDPAQPN
ncbi:MAG TPA: nuclear transport factor 2 family protein [Oculatellaceae cyanobacterium]